MTRKEIINTLEKEGIDYNPTALKAELELLLDATTKAELEPEPENETICEQKGCPDAEETDDGHCSICGHPIGEHRAELLAALG